MAENEKNSNESAIKRELVQAQRQDKSSTQTPVPPPPPDIIDSGGDIDIEAQAARQLQLAKQAAKDKASSFISEEDQNVLRKFADAGAAIFSESATKVILSGAKLGLELRRTVDESRFEGIPFLIILLMAVTKDFIIDPISDAGTLGILGALVNILINVVFFIFFFGKGAFLRKLAIRMIAPITIEYIPYLSMLPTYTLLILWMRYKINDEIQILEKDIERLEKKTQRPEIT